MSSRSLNKVLIIGNLTRDPELKYIPQGTAVANFGVATNRGWVSSGGEKQESTEFHNIVAWGKLGELCDRLLRKGSKVYLEGRLQTRDWVGEDSKKRYKTEVVIDQMILLGGGKDWEDSAKVSKESSEKSSGGASENKDVDAGSSAGSAIAMDEDVDLDEILADTDFDLEDTSPDDTSSEAGK